MSSPNFNVLGKGTSFVNSKYKDEIKLLKAASSILFL